MQTHETERRAAQPGVDSGKQPMLDAQAAVRVIRRFLTISVIALLCAFAAPSLRAEAIDPGAKAPTVDEPSDYRLDEYRKPVPATLKGATVISGAEAVKLWNDGTAIFIDVYPHAPKPPNLPAGTIWREPQHFSIEKAKWLPNIGYGRLSAETEAYFMRHLEQLTGGDKTKALVFFCVRNCWMSWNAGKRALAYGYSNVIWFSEGTDAWQEIGQPIEQAKPEP